MPARVSAVNDFFQDKAIAHNPMDVELPPSPTPPSPAVLSPDALEEELGWRHEKQIIEDFKREARSYANRKLAEMDALVHEADEDSPGTSPQREYTDEEESRRKRANALAGTKIGRYGEKLGSQPAVHQRYRNGGGGAARGGVALWSPRRAAPGPSPGPPGSPRHEMTAFEQALSQGPQPPPSLPGRRPMPRQFACAEPAHLAFLRRGRPGTAGSRTTRADSDGGDHDDLTSELRRAVGGDGAPATALMPYAPRGDGRSDVSMTAVLRERLHSPLFKLRETLAPPQRQDGRRPLSLRPGVTPTSSRPPSSARGASRPSTAASQRVTRPSTAMSHRTTDGSWDVADFGSGRSLAPRFDAPPRPVSARPCGCCPAARMR